MQSLFLLLDTRLLIHSRDEFDCDSRMLDEILNACRGSDLVGISLMSNAFAVSAKITEHIKKALNVPIIWGGIHSTIRPDECLDHADMACIGEGEAPMLDLVNRLKNGQDHTGVEGLWVRQNGKINRNKIPPLIQDLDSLPVDTYEDSNDKVLKGGRLIPVTRQLAQEMIGTQLTVFISRGCPYGCSFCCNNVLKDLYRGQKIVRYKGPEAIVKEIGGLVSKFKQVNRVFFSDDSFIIKPLDQLREFSQLYKKHIDLPFTCLLTAPSVTEEKVRCLIEAGLNDVRMGLQSASPRTLKTVYNRPISAESVKKASEIVNKTFSGNQILSYDLILDNPYETKEDLAATLRFLLTVPRPFTLRFFSLQLYPGTQLYKRAVEEKSSLKQFRDAYHGSYRSADGNYLNALFYLMKFIGLKRCPKIVGQVLLRDEMLFLLNRPWMDMVMKALRDFRSFWNYSLKLKVRFLSKAPTPVIKKGYTNL